MSERKNDLHEMLTAEDLQDFGLTRSMAYAFLNRPDVPVIKIGKRKFIRREKFYQWLEEQEQKKESDKVDGQGIL